MTSLPVTQARSRLYELLDLTAASHEPIQITGKRANAVLVSEEDCLAQYHEGSIFSTVSSTGFIQKRRRSKLFVCGLTMNTFRDSFGPSGAKTGIGEPFQPKVCSDALCLDSRGSGRGYRCYGGTHLIRQRQEGFPGAGLNVKSKGMRPQNFLRPTTRRV